MAKLPGLRSHHLAPLKSVVFFGFIQPTLHANMQNVHHSEWKEQYQPNEVNSRRLAACRYFPRHHDSPSTKTLCWPIVVLEIHVRVRQDKIFETFTKQLPIMRPRWSAIDYPANQFQIRRADLWSVTSSAHLNGNGTSHRPKALHAIERSQRRQAKKSCFQDISFNTTNSWRKTKKSKLLRTY